jgi:hypothetical protein
MVLALLETGREAEARKILDELKERSTREFIPVSIVGIVALYLGEIDEGIALLWRALEQQETTLPTVLPHYPFVGPLRKLPDYPKLMAAIGWPIDE